MIIFFIQWYQQIIGNKTVLGSFLFFPFNFLKNDLDLHFFLIFPLQ